MTEEKIEKEVQARVDFKINEILKGVENQANLNWQIVFNNGNPKYSNYWEAFSQLKSMIKNEIDLPTPYNEMYEIKYREIRDEYVDILSERFLRRGTPNYIPNLRFVVSTVEKILNEKNNN